MSKKPSGFIVVYRPENEFTLSLYGSDPECIGALIYTETSPSVFPTREAALKAIRITRQKELLYKEQGGPVNTDFTTDRKNLRIVALVDAPGL